MLIAKAIRILLKKWEKRDETRWKESTFDGLNIQFWFLETKDFIKIHEKIKLFF